MKQLFRILLTLFLLLPVLPGAVQAATIAPVTGEIERLTLNDPTDIYSGGVIVVGGQEVILPKNLLIDLPANRLTLQQIFAQAPAACITAGESGLAKADTCNNMGAGGNATISANRTNAGNVIAGDVLLQKGIESVTGTVTYINYTEGYFRLNGITGDATTGVMVRLNDPTSRHTVQSGAGCAGGPNCSPDPRFTLDPDNYTNTFTTGYPLCIPSTVTRQFPGLPAITGVAAIPAGPTQASAVDGTGDLLCPSTNRFPQLVTEPAVADSRRFAPIALGDWITAEGNFETVSGTRFLSSHTTTVGKALSTQNAPGQPDYLFLEEVFIEAPAFQNQRARAMWIGFTTLAPTDVDIWSIHRDPTTNDAHEFPLASVQGCDNAAGVGSCSSQGLVGAGGNIFRIRYDVDFLLAITNPQGRYPGGARSDLNPCWQLLNSPRFNASNPGICPGATQNTQTGTGITLANNFGILSPVPHEIIARTGHKLDSPVGSLVTIDINGLDATNGEYLFPLGLNLGGLEVAEMNEIDLNAFATPLTFEGIPWNLDRRLSPSGCLNAGGCEAGTLGTYALDPFPFSGLDPRTQADFAVAGTQGGLPTGGYNDPVFTASALNNVRNRIFSYVTNVGAGVFNFNGTSTVLPYNLGIFPADPGPITINPTPIISILPPIVDEDAATGSVGVPVIIDVVANDFPVFGSIDPTTVTIVTPPASGSAVANGDGTVTFTPSTVGTVTFTYTVANNFGAVSLPGTVTVKVVSPATAVALIADQTSPHAIGTPVTFTAAGSGGSGSYEYRFWLNSGSGYAVAQDYSTSNTFVWSPAAPGAYDILVDVRNAGTTVLRDASKSINFFQITAASTPATAVTLVSDVASPQVANTPITFTANGSGGSGTYEYRFWINSGSGFLIARDYTTSNTFVWTPAVAGNYDILVDVRNVGSSALREAFEKIFFYQIQPAPTTSVSITPDKASPQAPGTQIVFTAAGSGGSGTYEYRFWLNSGSGYTIVQDYSTLPTWTWLPASTGNYDVLVDVRSVGSAAARDASNNVFFYQIQ